MKKWFVILLTLVLLVSGTALAEAQNDGQAIFDALRTMLGGVNSRAEITVSAEAAELPEKLTIEAQLTDDEEMVCIVGGAVLDGQRIELNAVLTASGIELSMAGEEPLNIQWADIPLDIKASADGTAAMLEIGGDGPNRELISFTVKSDRAEDGNGEYSLNGTFIEASGAVYTVWASVQLTGTAQERGMTGEFAFTQDEDEYAAESIGSVRVDENGSVSGENTCTLTLNDEEQGVIHVTEEGTQNGDGTASHTITATSEGAGALVIRVNITPAE